jgi:hypothetical protein
MLHKIEVADVKAQKFTDRGASELETKDNHMTMHTSRITNSEVLESCLLYI